jgi:hypothetical protein
MGKWYSFWRQVNNSGSPRLVVGHCSVSRICLKSECCGKDRQPRSGVGNAGSESEGG